MADYRDLPSDQICWLRVDLASRLLHAEAEIRRVKDEMARIDVVLRERLIPGELIPVDDRQGIVLDDARPNGRRAVNRAAVHHHIEVLGPLGLGPVETPTVKVTYPSISAIERMEHRLRAAGVDPAELIEIPPMGEPQVLIVDIKPAVPAGADRQEGT